MTATDKREAIRRKVQLLMNKAESTTYGPEQEALLAKVNELMTEFAIAEWELSREEGHKVDPILHSFVCSQQGSDIWYDLVNLAFECANFMDCKSVFSGMNGKGRWDITAKLVGFPDNVRNAEFLFHSLHLQMMQTLAPKWDPTEDVVLNVQRCKEAGMKWEQVWALAYGAGVVNSPELNRSTLIGWQKKYKAYCLAQGIEPVTANPKNYKTNFSYGFVSAIESRMHRIKADAILAQQKAEKESGISSSTAIVLADREKEVDEAYAMYFPRVGKGVARTGGKYNSAASSAGRAAGQSADLGTSGSRMGTPTRGALG